MGGGVRGHCYNRARGVEMNLQEVLSAAQDGETWFRPVEWSGTGRAYKIRNGRVYLSSKYNLDGGREIATTVGRLVKMHPVDEWEVVSEDTVITERGELE